jgi:hypothetical protein
MSLSSHAEGVDPALVEGMPSGGVPALETVADVLKVIVADLEFQHLVDHGEEVGQRAHGGEWRKGGRAKQTACRGIYHRQVLKMEFIWPQVLFLPS